MPFDVYPAAGNPPIPLGATVAVPFTQRPGAAVDPGGYVAEMFIRVAVQGTGAVKFALIADGTPSSTLSNFTTTISSPTSGNDFAEALGLITEPNGVFQIRVGFVVSPSAATTWQLQVTNSVGTAREFVFVVADTLAATAQPWIDVAAPAALAFDLLNGQHGLDSVHVTNKGTGSTSLTGVNPALPAGLTVTSALPVTLGPTASTDVRVQFAPTGPASVELTAAPALTTTPPDTTAGTSPGHRNTFAVTARAGSLEVVLLLDASGSMGWAPDGTPLAPHDANARIAELADGGGEFLDKLAHFGAGHGRFGIARFPQATPGNPASFDVVPMGAIPPQSGISTAQGLVAGMEPTDNTPMGDGLDRVLDVATSYFGTDLGNRRWLILMSDGAHNAGTHNPLEFVAPPFGTASPADSLNGKKIQLTAIGYGLRPSSNVPFHLLETLQAGSFNGSTTNAGQIFTVDQPHTTGTDLAAKLIAAIKAGLTTAVESSSDPDAVFLSGQGEARHDVLVSPHDGRLAFSLTWNTPNPFQLRLELLTPDCERITPETAGEGAFQAVTFRNGRRYQSYYVDPAFLADPAHARFGTWTMVVTVPQIIGSPGEEPAIAAAQAEDSVYERYAFDVLMESTLLLRLSTDRVQYFAGDDVGVAARLTVDGLPVTGANVVLSTTEPGQSSANWLAGLDVPADALAEAEKRLHGQDATPILVKTLAAQIAGFVFDAATQPGSFVMTDADESGTYRATVPGSGIPETHTLYVTAPGTTADGVAFRREAQASIYVQVRPEPDFTVLSVLQTGAGAATVTVFPRDRFGNVLLVEPDTTVMRVTARGAELAGPLTSAVDGSYQQQITFPAGSTPSVGLDYQGDPVVAPRPLPRLDHLHYVDEVVRFDAGPVTSANQHADPAAALGTVVGKPDDTFVALGAGGVLVVAVREQVVVATGGDDVTVFVHSVGDRRSYRVDGYDVRARRWVPLGESPGVTQGFGLRAAGLDATRGIRITDTSGRAKAGDGSNLSAPGACVAAVGVVRVERHRRYGGRFCRWCRWWRWWPARRPAQ